MANFEKFRRLRRLWQIFSKFRETLTNPNGRVGPGPSFCWTRAKFLETSSSLRPSNFREISGKSVTTGDRQGTAPPSMSRRPTTNPTPKHSAHHPVVVSKHESCADGISKGADLLLPKHELQEVGFPWKFPEISGNFRRSAVGGRRSSPVGGRLSSAGGQISLEISGIVVSFEGSDFQKNF